ncbi:MAG: hypothetical protein IKB86_08070 [Clostridia bacterium]|nr:hypothetical protein [Clostridia bacterium]
MDKIFSIVAFALVAVCTLILIKKYAPEFTVGASICIGCALIFFILEDVVDIRQKLNVLNVSAEWISSVVKITFISFVGQWGVQLCRDAGENSIADKVELAVKILVLTVCLPYVDKLITFATEIQ